MISIPEKPDPLELLFGTEIKVYEFLNRYGLIFFDYDRKYLFFQYSSSNYINGISMYQLVKNTNYRQLVDYSNTCDPNILLLGNKQSVVMAKYFGNIIDKCVVILSINGKLLCELIIAHNIKLINYRTLIQLPLICKNQFINHVVKIEKSQYKKYKKGHKVECRNNCGNRIYIEIYEILDESPICCKCKTPNRPCVECTNHPTIRECRCRRFFHEDPEYRGKWQRCEDCRRH